ncbi:protein kinase [Dactylosporangium aurantiacum]|uniref:non-specific serine/threonine protein kinase n=1 Tax=Dactylosporangium aurantiacum TaxID=35754 RepID=A0A9Q9MJ09_9ACTN|nr:serine/threonine protein kinase [Dactylosporangium aurantiacum]MDG6110174.1 protein kinase [Dactylosporangium aurantiacum]UWZ54206.1 protein kinase [Dactylosporangium aurantiacum]
MERYRLIEPLGVGGMSVVWRAHDEVLGRPVAVKQLTAAADPASRRRIQAEARAAALLSHPHIAAVHDFGHTADGAPFVVMELVEGESLEDRLLRVGGPLPVTESLRIAAQLASALAAVHARGLVHHDVKPANVMLTAGGAKLVDFGISAVAGDDTDQLLGTPAYVAPERLRGVAPSAATDIYALGVVLHRMLTGALPWPVTTTEEMLHAHRKLPPAPLPATLDLPAGVAGTARRCLAKAPANRPDAADLATLFAVMPPTRRLTFPARRLLTGDHPATARLAAARHLAPVRRLRDLTLAGPVKRRITVAAATALILGAGAAGAAAQDREPVAAWTPATTPVDVTTPQASDPATDPSTPTTDLTTPAADPTVIPAANPGAQTAAGVKKPGVAPPPAEKPGGAKKGKGPGKRK